MIADVVGGVDVEVIGASKRELRFFVLFFSALHIAFQVLAVIQLIDSFKTSFGLYTRNHSLIVQTHRLHAATQRPIQSRASARLTKRARVFTSARARGERRASRS